MEDYEFNLTRGLCELCGQCSQQEAIKIKSVLEVQGCDKAHSVCLGWGWTEGDGQLKGHEIAFHPNFGLKGRHVRTEKFSEEKSKEAR